MSTKLNGRTIEKEVTTKQLHGGITEKVIVLKDGDQKCITTITENSKTGEQNFSKQFVNLDESNYYFVWLWIYEYYLLCLK